MTALIAIASLFILFVVIVILWGIGAYNKLVKLRNRFKNAFSEIKRLAQKDGVIDFDEQCLMIAMGKSIRSFHINSKFGHRPFPKVRTQSKSSCQQSL